MNLKKELSKMEVSDLRIICRELGVSCPKTKNSIINRLLQPLKKNYKMESKPQVIIYTLSRCGWCINSKDLLKKNNIKYIEHEISDDKNEQKMKEHYKRVNTNELTDSVVPQIFIADKIYIGGFTELSNGGIDIIKKEI